jgi:hypothetical protein
MTRPNEPIVDPGNVLEVFTDDVAAVTPFGAVTHLLFTLRRQDPYSGTNERVLQLRLIIPTEQVKRIGRVVMDGRLEIQPRRQSLDEDEKSDAPAIH